MTVLISTILTFIICLSTSPVALATTTKPETALSLGIPCDTCGLCTAPLGICLLYYLLAVLIIALLLVIFVGRGKRCPICKQYSNRKAHMCAKCGYDFDNGLQSTLSINVADSPELMQLREMNNPDAANVTHNIKVIPVQPEELQSATDNAQTAKNINTSELTNKQQITTCPHCGAPVVNPKAMFCEKCGKQLR